MGMTLRMAADAHCAYTGSLESAGCYERGAVVKGSLRLTGITGDDEATPDSRFLYDAMEVAFEIAL